MFPKYYQYIIQKVFLLQIGGEGKRYHRNNR